MRLSKLPLFVFLALLIAALFFPWVGVEERGVEIGGFASKGTSAYGRPGLLHLVLCFLILVFVSLNKIWARRFAYFFGALNIAWAVRNYILISACSGGICPEKYTALYVLPITSFLILVSLFLMDYNRKTD